jgi:hypothetical protein
MKTPRSVNEVRRTRLLHGAWLRTLLPDDTATPAALGAGTCRRLPLHACCYQVIIGNIVWHRPHYIGGQSYKCLTPIPLVSCPHYNTKSKRNLTRTQYSTQTQQWIPIWIRTKCHNKKKLVYYYSNLCSRKIFMILSHIYSIFCNFILLILSKGTWIHIKIHVVHYQIWRVGQWCNL